MADHDQRWGWKDELRISLMNTYHWKWMFIYTYKLHIYILHAVPYLVCMGRYIYIYTQISSRSRSSRWIQKDPPRLRSCYFCKLAILKVKIINVHDIDTQKNGGVCFKLGNCSMFFLGGIEKCGSNHLTQVCWKCQLFVHPIIGKMDENGVTLTINPIYTPYPVGIYCAYIPF